MKLQESISIICILLIGIISGILLWAYSMIVSSIAVIIFVILLIKNG